MSTSIASLYVVLISLPSVLSEEKIRLALCNGSVCTGGSLCSPFLLTGKSFVFQKEKHYFTTCLSKCLCYVDSGIGVECGHVSKCWIHLILMSGDGDTPKPYYIYLLFLRKMVFMKCHGAFHAI